MVLEKVASKKHDATSKVPLPHPISSKSKLQQIRSRASMARRWSPPALPAPRPLRSCADTLKVHSLGGLEGGKSGAGYGDDSFLGIQPTSEVLLAHDAALLMSSIPLGVNLCSHRPRGQQPRRRTPAMTACILTAVADLRTCRAQQVPLSPPAAKAQLSHTLLLACLL